MTRRSHNPGRGKKPAQNEGWGPGPEVVKAPRRRDVTPPAPHIAAEGEAFPIRVTHPDKLLFPAEGITKRDLLAYYQVAARWMLPLVVDRPLTLVRCPQGAGPRCFYQRNWTYGFPEAVKGSHPYEGETQLAIRDENGLLSLVQMNALEIHIWGCRQNDLKHPDQLVLDLDPGPGLAWGEVAAAAGMVREMLGQLKIRTFVKTTGGKGLHVLFPIQPTIEWDAAHAFCEQIAAAMAKRSDRIVTNMRKDLREGKLYVDFQRNHETATAVAAYSTRARQGAAVSMPLEWEQLPEIRSGNQFSVNEALTYLRRRRRDPWAAFEKARVDLRKIASAGKGQ